MTRKMNSNFSGKGQILTNGIIKQNPTFVLVLGMCPTLAVTTSAFNGLGMGLAATVVLVFSNLLVSMLRNIIPDKVRIPAFVLIIATFVTIVEMVIRRFVPPLYDALGIFLPLIVVNCIILARAEAFASQNKPFDSVLDGLGMGIGFTLALFVLGLIREILGAGSFFSFELGSIGFDGSFGPLQDYALGFFVMPAGGFLTLGLLMGLINFLQDKSKQKAARKAKEQPEELDVVDMLIEENEKLQNQVTENTVSTVAIDAKEAN